MSARRARTPIAARFEVVPPIAPDGVQHPLERAQAPHSPILPALARLAAFVGPRVAPSAGLDPDGGLIFSRQRQTRGARWR